MSLRVIAAIAVAVNSVVATASAPVCRNPLDGNWAIESYRFDGEVVAISSEEAKARVGKPVIIAARYVSFPGYPRCSVRESRVERSTDHKSFPRVIMLGCQGGGVIPGFYVGRRCDRLLASLDGATYVLRRQR